MPVSSRVALPVSGSFGGARPGLAYGALGAPLAFVALPLYVVLPSHYASQFGVPLAALGAVLLGARLFDALVDPLIGRWADALFACGARAAWGAIAGAALLLAVGFRALFFPAVAGLAALLLWCAAGLAVTYFGYSVVTVIHQSWGARLGGDEAQRVRIVAWREGLSLLGVLTASVLPSLVGLGVTTAVFAAMLLAGVVALRAAPRPSGGRDPSTRTTGNSNSRCAGTGPGTVTETGTGIDTSAETGAPAAPAAAATAAEAAPVQPTAAAATVVTFAPAAAPPAAVAPAAPGRSVVAKATAALRPAPRRSVVPLALPLRNPAFRGLLAVYLVNGIASALPATLVLFFIRDRLQAGAFEPLFLASYFAAGALSIPLWVRAVRRVGLTRAWLGSMVLAVAVFAWAARLGAGDVAAYTAVCLLSGVALGADLTLPSALLAGLIQRAGHAGRAEGAYFGWWNFATKLNLALAAGIALPALQAFGYAPGRHDATALAALTAAYCLLPCALKLLAAGLLHAHGRRTPALGA